MLTEANNQIQALFTHLAGIGGITPNGGGAFCLRHMHHDVMKNMDVLSFIQSLLIFLRRGRERGRGTNHQPYVGTQIRKELQRFRKSPY